MNEAQDNETELNSSEGKGGGSKGEDESRVEQQKDDKDEVGVDGKEDSSGSGNVSNS